MQIKIHQNNIKKCLSFFSQNHIQQQKNIYKTFFQMTQKYIREIFAPTFGRDFLTRNTINVLMIFVCISLVLFDCWKSLTKEQFECCAKKKHKKIIAEKNRVKKLNFYKQKVVRTKQISDCFVGVEGCQITQYFSNPLYFTN